MLQRCLVAVAADALPVWYRRRQRIRRAASCPVQASKHISLIIAVNRLCSHHSLLCALALMLQGVSSCHYVQHPPLSILTATACITRLTLYLDSVVGGLGAVQEAQHGCKHSM